MRRLLGVLREDVDAESTLRPQPGLRQLNALLDEVRDAATGGGVRLIVSGSVGPNSTPGSGQMSMTVGGSVSSCAPAAGIDTASMSSAMTTSSTR